MSEGSVAVGGVPWRGSQRFAGRRLVGARPPPAADQFHPRPPGTPRPCPRRHAGNHAPGRARAGATPV